MRKHLLLLSLALVLSTIASAQLLTVNGRIINSVTAGVFNQRVALIINAGSPASTINDTVTTDSLGFFARTYSVPMGWTQGTVVAISQCGNSSVIDSTFWSPATNYVASFGNILCTGSPVPVNSSICGTISTLAAGDTAKIELYSLRFGSVRLDTTIYRFDSLNTGWTAYCFSLQPGAYRIKAELTPGSTNASTVLPTWFGNTTNPLNALIVNVANATFIQNVNIQLQTNPSAPVTTIFGNVTGYTPSSPLGIDTVEAIIIEVNNGVWTPIDTVYAIDSLGNAWFSAQVNRIGTFSVLARLRSGAASNYVPTYFGNATTWTAANTFPLSSNGSTYQLVITLQPATGTGSGGGSVGGGVNGGLPITGTAGLHGVQVQLKNAQGAILKFTHTSNNGSYNIASLPEGTYHLRVEMMGMNSSVWTFTIDQANLNHNVNFTVGSNGISTSVADESVLIGSVYPNPAKDVLNVVLRGIENTSTQLILRDLQGRSVKTFNIERTSGEQLETISIADLKPGLYMLETSGSGKVHKVLVY
jgi:hypothetical protein